MTFDAIDQHILSILRDDGRASHATIAKRVGLSAPAVGERVRKLEGLGVIRGYRAVFDAEALGRGVCAYVSIAPQPRYPAANLVENLGPLPEIEELHAVAGEHGYIAKVRVASTQKLDSFLDRLWMVEGVERTQTTVILRTTVDRPMHLAFGDGTGEPV
ncbi:MAG: Lrp/AsnC family transcriptional regulator [Deinococcota bacterium]|jgi:Lrp/AsnC family leucine-responsive transcriptional regulator|nr:Lrp/AsnC family transcriptional regulator [Deinococcota bacterium]